MPALMAKRASSERCAIRRELHRRRKLAAAPKGGIVKKSSTQQISESIHKSSADETAGQATNKPPSMTMTMPTPRPRAGVATSPASILQHAPAAVVATKKQIASVAKEIAASVPLGQVAKRCTAPPRRSALIPAASKMKVSAVKRVIGVPSNSASPCRSASMSIPPASSGVDNTELSATAAGATYIKNMPTIPARPRSSSISVKKGMTVKVRTRAGMLPSGHCLVLWLAARVVSDAAADDGFLDVIYNGNFPRDDPSRTVRVAMDDVRSMPAVGES